MDEIAYILTRQAIQSRVGAAVKIDYDDFSEPTPLGTVVRVAEPHLQHPIKFFWVDDGIAGHFSLLGDDSAELVFHTRYLVLSQYLQALFRPELEKMDVLCETALLRFAAEFLLVHGFVDQAVQTLAKSRLDNGFYINEPAVNPDFEYVPFGARYMSLWFSGVCHELGHLADANTVSLIHGFQALTPERIDQARGAIAEHFYGARSENILTLVKERGAGSKASIASIQEEARCDIFGFLLLLESYAAIIDMGAQVQESSEVEDFLYSFLVEVAALDLLEQPKMWAKWFVNGRRLIEAGPAEHRLAVSSRINALLQCVQDTKALERIAKVWKSAEQLSSLSEDDIHALLLKVQEHFDFFESGIEGAREFMSSSEMRDVTLFNRYLELLRDNHLARNEAVVFLGIAERCGRQSPELDLMAHICGYTSTSD